MITLYMGSINFIHVLVLFKYQIRQCFCSIRDLAFLSVAIPKSVILYIILDSSTEFHKSPGSLDLRSHLFHFSLNSRYKINEFSLLLHQNHSLLTLTTQMFCFNLNRSRSLMLSSSSSAWLPVMPPGLHSTRASNLAYNKIAPT